MSKKTNRKSVKYDGPMTPAMKFFLAGCVAELYLLIVRRFYINGTMDQMLAWYDYLMYLPFLGLAAAAVGAVLLHKWKEKKAKRELAWYLLGGGASRLSTTGIFTPSSHTEARMEPAAARESMGLLKSMQAG